MDIVYPARPLNLIKPDIASAGHKNKHGTVALTGTITTAGTVSNLTVTSGKRELAQAALEAVRQWQYRPQLVNGHAVEIQHFFRITFSSNGVQLGIDDLSPDLPLEPAEDVVKEIAEGTLFRVGGTVTAPKAQYAPSPEYSEAARKEKYQGFCLLGVVIGEKGTIQNLWVIRPLGYGLDEKAIEAVRQWRFEPARKGGQPVPVFVTVEVTFRIG